MEIGNNEFYEIHSASPHVNGLRTFFGEIKVFFSFKSGCVVYVAHFLPFSFASCFHKKAHSVYIVTSLQIESEYVILALSGGGTVYHFPPKKFLLLFLLYIHQSFFFSLE